MATMHSGMGFDEPASRCDGTRRASGEVGSRAGRGGEGRARKPGAGWGRALGLLAAVLAVATLWLATPAQAAPRPNVVVIVTDDMDSSSLQHMPLTLQAIAAEGVSFQRYHVSAALCAPSRVTMLTGRYPHNTGVQNNAAPDGGYWAFRDRGLEASALPVWLQGAGYRTGLVGKYLNGYPGTAGSTAVPPGWTSWIGLASVDVVDVDILVEVDCLAKGLA